ncbi:sulfate adenylyltransferase subunit 1 [Bosea sp. (in: a-proteobacteria)]|uniref:sulfate adenylyltransferase subunit 1 n=1 Tax=Bosea sp. (in: a-proteobacteria) TaxID=1871050 RepID=UPI003B3A81AE
MGSTARKLAQPTVATREDAANDHQRGRKPALRFFTCGSVDDGKSTLIGRLLYEAGAILDDQMDTLANDSRRFGTRGAELDFALLVDGLSAEREQGITIDVAYRYFATPRRGFVVADTPGHEQYTRNMATGASTADLAVILVDARLGLLPQTRRHSTIVSLVGVRQVVLAVNKMDLVGYDEAVFRKIVADYAAIAETLGLSQVTAIPISARDGDNILGRSPAMPWYRGPALLPFLEEVDAGRPQAEGGLMLPVQWVNRPNADFRGYVGTIARGTLSVGDRLAVLPSGRASTVTRIIGPSGDIPRAGIGQPVTVTLADAIDVSRGDVLVAAEQRPLLRSTLRAKLLWTGETPLAAENRYWLKLASSRIEAAIGELHHAIDIQTLKPVSATALGPNDIGVATLLLDRPVPALPFARNTEMGGFILIDRVTHETVAFGFVGEEVAPERPRQHEPELAGRIRRWVGPPDSLARALRFGQVFAHLASSVALAGLLWGLTGSAPLAIGIGLADLVLRPLVILSSKLGMAGLWRGLRARSLATGENVHGGGI